MRRRSSEDIIKQILARSGGLRARIDSNCVYCTYDQVVPGTWRQQVEACSVTECPLHTVRSRSLSRQRPKVESDPHSSYIHCEEGSKTGVVAT
jgi:hypothetical protein